MESKPAILFPLVSIREPMGSHVMMSHVCLGSGSSCRTLSMLSERLSPSSFCERGEIETKTEIEREVSAEMTMKAKVNKEGSSL